MVRDTLSSQDASTHKILDLKFKLMNQGLTNFLPVKKMSEYEVIKLFICLTKHGIYHAHNVKMPTIVGISTFISMINTTSKSLKVRKVFSFQRFSFSEQLKFNAQSMLFL